MSMSRLVRFSMRSAPPAAVSVVPVAPVVSGAAPLLDVFPAQAAVAMRSESRDGRRSLRMTSPRGIRSLWKHTLIFAALLTGGAGSALHAQDTTAPSNPSSGNPPTSTNVDSAGRPPDSTAVPPGQTGARPDSLVPDSLRRDTSAAGIDPVGCVGAGSRSSRTSAAGGQRAGRGLPGVGRRGPRPAHGRVPADRHP